MKRVVILAPVLLAHLTACASQTQLPAPVRAAVDSRHAGQTVELRQSCYYGDLYDENEKWLLTPYPFSETYHIVDTDGAPIHPRNQRGIVPAGSRFVIERIEFPDPLALAKRMLTTPRYNPWVYLVPAADAEGLPKGRKHFILLLPMGLTTEAAVEEELAERLSPAGETTAWLAERRPTVQVAIRHKDILPGMSLEELVASMGEPMHWFKEGQARVAWYPGREAWLADGRVTEVKPAREAPITASR